MHEDLYERAGNGDVSAMLTIAKDIYDRHQEKDLEFALEESLPWYVQAADCGSEDGAALAIIGYTGLIALAKERGEWKQAIARANRASDFCMKVLEDPRFKGMLDAELDPCINLCLFVEAICYYLDEEYEEALEDIARIDRNSEYHALATVLKGLCLNELDRDDEGHQILLMLDDHPESILPKAHDTVDEEILSRGFLHQALYIRLILGDTNRAQALLSRGAQIIKDPDVLASITEELSFYKKKLFGGYKFIG